MTEQQVSRGMYLAQSKAAEDFFEEDIVTLQAFAVQQEREAAFGQRMLATQADRLHRITIDRDFEHARAESLERRDTIYQIELRDWKQRTAQAESERDAAVQRADSATEMARDANRAVIEHMNRAEAAEQRIAAYETTSLMGLQASVSVYRAGRDAAQDRAESLEADLHTARTDARISVAEAMRLAAVVAQVRERLDNGHRLNALDFARIVDAAAPEEGGS